MGMSDFLAMGAGTSYYEESYKTSLLALARQLSTDYVLPYADYWACADPANMTLANAVIDSGLARVTITAGTSGGIDSNAVLMLHCDETSGTPVDSSSSAKTITPNSTAASSAQSKFGGYSRNLSGSYMYAAPSSDFNFLAGDFTAECWLYLTAATSYATNVLGMSPAYSWSLGISGTTPIFFAGNGSSWTTSASGNMASTSISLNTWNHLALVRHSGVWKIYLNGVTVLTFSESSSLAAMTVHQLQIGSAPAYLSSVFSGCYIDEIRISNVARYTADFTPATSAFSTTVTADTVNAGTIIGNSKTLTNTPVAGRFFLRIQNLTDSTMIDMGDSGSNHIEVYRSIDGGSTWSSALPVTITDLGSGLFSVITPEFDCAGATGIAFKLQTFVRSTVAPYVGILDNVFSYRSAA